MAYDLLQTETLTASKRYYFVAQKQVIRYSEHLEFPIKVRPQIKISPALIKIFPLIFGRGISGGKIKTRDERKPIGLTSIRCYTAAVDFKLSA